MLKKLVKAFSLFLAFLSATLPQTMGVPKVPAGERLDYDKFTLVWQDEFDGDTIDHAKWGTEWWVTQRKGGFWHEDFARVEDGNLIISAEYKDEAMPNRYYDDWHEVIDFKPYKPGWYTTMLTTRDSYEQCYGYFEVRCILPAAQGMWSAFWMMNEGVYNIDGTGNDGTEIDVFESMYHQYHKFGVDEVTVNLHYDGYGEAHRRVALGKYLLENNPYEEYNTYGVEWNEKEYIFYINGVEACRSNAGGVSDNPEYLLLSCEFNGENGIPGKNDLGIDKVAGTPKKNWPAEFKVDYVRCYQYNDLLEK